MCKGKSKREIFIQVDSGEARDGNTYHCFFPPQCISNVILYIQYKIISIIIHYIYFLQAVVSCFEI